MSIAECRSKLPMPALWPMLWPGVEGPHEGKRAQMVVAAWRGENTPSVNVTMNGDGWLFFDHGQKAGGDELKLVELAHGCERKKAMEIYHTMAGVEWKTSTASSGNRNPNSKQVAWYDYLDEDGRLRHQTVRFEPGLSIGQSKSFAQRRPAQPGMTQATRSGRKEAKKDNRDGRWWLWTLEGIEPVLFNLPAILSTSGEIWLVEGEKDALALGKFGVVVTTAPMGAKNWRESYTQSLAGRDVVLCGDSDAAGVAHLLTVGRALRTAGCSVSTIKWEAVVGERATAEKWDAAKFLEQKKN